MSNKTIKLDLQVAKRLYKVDNSELKSLLEKSFEKKELSSDIKDRINNFSDVLSEIGKTEDEIIPWKSPINKNQRSLNANARIQAITEAYNEGEVLDFTNKTQPKYYLWFERKSSAHGGGWSLYVVNYNYCYYAHLGSGCYFKRKEDAMDAYKKFKDVWDEYLPE
jgi:hypothetical protein